MIGLLPLCLYQNLYIHRYVQVHSKFHPSKNHKTLLKNCMALYKSITNDNEGMPKFCCVLFALFISSISVCIHHSNYKGSTHIRGLRQYLEFESYIPSILCIGPCNTELDILQLELCQLRNTNRDSLGSYWPVHSIVTRPYNLMLAFTVSLLQRWMKSICPAVSSENFE